MYVNEHRHQRLCSGETAMHNLRQMPLCLEAFRNAIGATDCTFSILRASVELLKTEKINVFEKKDFFGTP